MNSRRIPCLTLVIFAALLLAISPIGWADAEPNAVRLWDTGTPLTASADLGQRSQWRAITSVTAYSPTGDVVAEAQRLTVLFASWRGDILLSSKTDSPVRAAIRPVELAGKEAVITAIKMVELNGVVMIEADFRAGAQILPITCTFREGSIVSVRPEGKTSGISITAPIEVAMVPSILGDDLLYEAKNYPAAKTLSLPSEHFLIGLLNGERNMLVMTWQEAMPSVQLLLTSGTTKKTITGIQLIGGEGVSLAMLEAPGIWHREALKPEYLERDVPMAWKPPFPARWLTQLKEDDVMTTFEFQDEKREHWRGGINSYTLPVWFDNGKPMFSLGKAIPPDGEAIIYFLERYWGTPREVVTPMEVVQQSLSERVRDGILSTEARQTWWPMRPDCAIGGETCDVMNALQKVFAEGKEVEQQLFVRGGAEDMVFHLEVMYERNGRYYPFAKNMVTYLDAQAKAHPELASYVKELRAIAEEMLVTYDNARDTMGNMEQARELEVKTIALAQAHRPDNEQRLEELRQGWCGMGGTVEELSRREHTFARTLYQLAAYRAAEHPKAMPLAEEIRRRTKQCLARPDSYEMWENF